jgi:hypothetical protein
MLKSILHQSPDRREPAGTTRRVFSFLSTQMANTAPVMAISGFAGAVVS